MNGVFLTIGGTDVSEHLNKAAHDVNTEDVFETWTDANWIDHRTIVRTRTGGTVTAGFASEAEHAAFLALLAAQRQPGGYYAAQVYSNNRGGLVSGEFFIDTNGEGRWDLVNGRQWLTLELTLTER